jgi:formylglycine-generating enzyme required for sulfatase activity
LPSSGAKGISMPKIFISYSHKDEDWKDRLVTHLGVLRHQRLFDLWDDRRIAAGKDWHQEIQEAMATANVAILLVSANFLISAFILNQEIPHLLERRDEEGVRIFPVIIKPCAWQMVDWLSRMQVRPTDGRPLSAGSEHQIDADLTAITTEVYQSLQLAESSSSPSGPVPPQPSPDAHPQELRNGIGMEFVLIPAGEFLMGSTDRLEEERPIHKVQISQPFYLGRYPVTQAQWKDLMRNNPSKFQGDLNRPVEQVSWEDVQGFIRLLNREEGGSAYRLPTEAEWEYACRAGSPTAYWFGDDANQLGKYAWYKANAEEETHPVGKKEPNVWGLYDMHGNVFEWVHDWYETTYYQRSPAQDPSGPSFGWDRVDRGGSWNHNAWDCRSARRGRLTPGADAFDTGFRLARTAW